MCLEHNKSIRVLMQETIQNGVNAVGHPGFGKGGGGATTEGETPSPLKLEAYGGIASGRQRIFAPFK